MNVIESKWISDEIDLVIDNNLEWDSDEDAITTLRLIQKAVKHGGDIRMTELYGDLPIKATADFLDQIPKDTNLYQVWIYFGKFLDKYYSEHCFDIVNDKPVLWEHDPKVVDALVKSYKDQGHSGYSHGVVTQEIMHYLSGQMLEEKRDKIKGLQK